MVERWKPKSKYVRWHDAIIERARGRERGSQYLEKHHIRPRCLGGTNAKSNLVYLTPEEHYVVHQLLIKIYPGNKKIVNAAMLMAVDKHGNRTGSKLYGWIKRRYSESMRGNTRTLGFRYPPRSQEYKDNVKATHTPERREANRQRMLGNKLGLGNKSTKGRKLRKRPPEVGQKISLLMMGNQRTKGMKLRPRSLEHTTRQRQSQIWTKYQNSAGILEAICYG